jgi:Poly(hydroxyalcanoate) granule associated protein (phasin)
MLNTFQHKTNRVGDTVFAASRQVWLAGLGAAAVTRDWAEQEATGVFRTLVKEGAAVESRAIRFVGNQVESSMTKANTVWKHTRTTVENVVRVYADTAAGIVRQTLPALLTAVKSAPADAPKRRNAQHARKSAASSTRKSTKRATRTTKSTPKR